MAKENKTRYCVCGSILKPHQRNCSYACARLVAKGEPKPINKPKRKKAKSRKKSTRKKKTR